MWPGNRIRLSSRSSAWADATKSAWTPYVWAARPTACPRDSSPRARASHHASVLSWSAVTPRSASTGESVRSNIRPTSTEIALKTRGTSLIRQRFNHCQFGRRAAVYGGKAAGGVKARAGLHAAKAGEHIRAGGPLRRCRSVNDAGPRLDASSGDLHRVQQSDVLGVFPYGHRHVSPPS